MMPSNNFTFVRTPPKSQWFEVLTIPARVTRTDVVNNSNHAKIVALLYQSTKR